MTSTRQSVVTSCTGHPRASFLGLPKELRLEIYDWVFYSTTLDADQLDSFPAAVHGPEDDIDADGRLEEDDEPGYHGEAGGHEEGEGVGQVAMEERRARQDDREAGDAHEETVEIYRPPVMTEQLNLVCRLLNEEIGRSWHGKVTYSFPCTVAFVDVLSQWPQNRLESVRRIRVVGYPIPLNSIDKSSYSTHASVDALPMFPGLRLDLLTVENIWLLPDGEELDGWCLDAVYDELCSLLQSQGWKRFEYVSGTLGFIAQQETELEGKIEDMKRNRKENGYKYGLCAMRPRLTELTHFNTDCTQTDEDPDEAKVKVAEWKAQHPEADTDSAKPAGLQVQAWAVRGTEEYAQNGDGRTQWIKDLLEHDNWIALRKTGEYLVCDGMDDPCRHL